jgi:hypothetical protein
MTSVLYRAIVGPVVPIFKDDETPEQYRRTIQPPAPTTLGSASSEPLGDFTPTEEYPTKPPLPY